MQLNSTIILDDVLYVPGLNYNLILVAQLVNDLFYTVMFSPELCVVQDHYMRRPIRVGEQRSWVFSSEKINRRILLSIKLLQGRFDTKGLDTHRIKL